MLDTQEVKLQIIALLINNGGLSCWDVEDVVSAADVIYDFVSGQPTRQPSGSTIDTTAL